MLTASLKFAPALLSLMLAAPPPAAAQGTGGITGTVRSAGTSALPGVTVTATNNGTRQRSRATTDNGGGYTLGGLAPGVYTVDFEKDGFQRSRMRNVAVSAGRATVADLNDLKFDLSAGQRASVTGVVTRRDADTFTVQDAGGAETVVRLVDRTSVRVRGGARGGANYATTDIMLGLRLDVAGRRDESGRLVAERVRFSEENLRLARLIENRVVPVERRAQTAENRLGEIEQNAQRLSGQLEELAAVSNAARGGAKAAQEAADLAVARVNATNERISALDDYTPQQIMSVNFRVGSAALSREAKTTLDEIAQQALKARGYVVEVRGFASADGSENANRRLSQQRADAVVRYLAETHNIPLRRIITPFGYGEKQAIADNATRDGRQQNRRVEVAVLVNRGLMQQASNLSPTKTEAATPTAQEIPAPAVDHQEALLKGDVKTVKLTGSNFDSIADATFEGRSLKPQVGADGRSVSLAVDRALTAAAGEKQINFILRDGRVTTHTLKVGRKE